MPQSKVATRGRVAKPKRGVAFSKKKILPKGMKDIYMLSEKPGKKAKPNSRIFPKEMSDKMNNLVKRGGIDGFENTFARLSIANTNSPHALPLMGDPSFLPAAGVHSGLSVQGSQASKLGVKAGLKLNANSITPLQPFFHTPGNAQDAYNLPKSYVEQIRWSRLMYNLSPYIHAISDLKAFYPYSKFKLTTPEPWVTQFYDSCAFNKRFNLYKFILRMSLSLKKFGEAIVWGNWKQDGIWPQTGQPRWVWDNFILLEPELVEIKKDILVSPDPQYFLRPNRDLEDLARRLLANDPDVAHLQGKLAEPLIEKILRRELVPMDSSTISAIQYITDGSGVRGTPPYQCLFTNFIFEDFVRLALMAQANRYHFPIELWLLGNLEKGIMPSVSDLEELKEMVTSAIQNPPFTIFFPPILDYKAMGVQGALLDIKNDMEYAHKQYLIGMGVNENMILGESGVFSSNDTAGNQSFIRLMQKDRDEIEEWMRWNFFEPLAQKNNLKMDKNGILVPIVPDIEWEKTLDFKAEDDEYGRLEKGWDWGLVDPDTMISAYLKRNPEEMKIKIEQAIGGVFDTGDRFGSEAARAKKAANGGGSGSASPAGPGGAPVEAPDNEGQAGAGTPATAPTAPKAAGASPAEGGKAGGAEAPPAAAGTEVAPPPGVI